MIDLHSHVLAGIDDGAVTIDESIAILKKMKAKGVKKVAATPHYSNYENKNYIEIIKNNLKFLRKKVKEEKIKIDILSGSEVLINKNIPKLLFNNQILTINNTNYILMETRLNIFPDYFLDIIHDIQAMGYKIIIAHPERYSYIQADYTKLYRWIEKYNLKLMLNSSSLLGIHGKRAKKTAEKILAMGLCHLMGSDTHGISKRPFTLKYGLKKAEKIKTGSLSIFKNNTEKVITNQQLQNFKIIREEKTLFNTLFSFFNL